MNCVDPVLKNLLLSHTFLCVFYLQSNTIQENPFEHESLEVLHFNLVTQELLILIILCLSLLIQIFRKKLM